MIPHHKRCMWRSHWKVRFLSFPKLRVERFWTSQTPWSDKKFETFFEKSIISSRRKKSEVIRADQLQIRLRVKKIYVFTRICILWGDLLKNPLPTGGASPSLEPRCRNPIASRPQLACRSCFKLGKPFRSKTPLWKYHDDCIPNYRRFMIAFDEWIVRAKW